MNYEDFVWFMLSEEDKSTLRSLQYWFKVIDLDDNLIITPHEMQHFYEEQVHRLEYLNHEPILFVDLLCQMNDLVKPSHEGHFSFEELRAVKQNVGIFFNCLVNLNKFIAYETRDLFQLKHQLTEFPDYSEWDRFAKAEYERLAMEEEQGEDSEVLDAMDGWDSEEENQAPGQSNNNNEGEENK
uniref:EF-hand domain-containing protein n=1 Tax=Strombidium rassoulzadegani TaxID=1082188 RepID=A0A7S3CIH8_9SPIT|mmetsp:Transcript_11823/g.19988  ORF Transcript_11823/g.19988 Transcript_11823/m.19988 type:complete len:184 (+) Transcript_11823:1807-2358(+)